MLIGYTASPFSVFKKVTFDGIENGPANEAKPSYRGEAQGLNRLVRNVEFQAVFRRRAVWDGKENGDNDCCCFLL